jgi:signal transduction histidine kinase
MSRSAKRLAKGDYGAHFEGGGYREAEELADALNYAAEELQKNDSLQKELVANISHDLRTPLTMIKGYSEVMRDIPEENTPENVQIIIDEAERLTELVNDMLDLSKIRAGTRKPELEMFDLTESVRAVLGRYEKFTESQSFVVLFEGGENVSVMADRTMILQVVYNLVNNALNYTGEDKTVRITQSVKNGKVRISVTDSGEGIAKEDIPYIWDRYYKVDKVHKRAVVGTGLGLSIVKGILESHGATYGVESVVG